MAKLTRKYRKNCKKRGGTTKTHKKIKYKRRIDEANGDFFKKLLASIYYVIELVGFDLNKESSDEVQNALNKAIGEYKKIHGDGFNLDTDPNAQTQIIAWALKTLRSNANKSVSNMSTDALYGVREKSNKSVGNMLPDGTHLYDIDLNSSQSPQES